MKDMQKLLPDWLATPTRRKKRKATAIAKLFALHANPIIMREFIFYCRLVCKFVIFHRYFLDDFSKHLNDFFWFIWDSHQELKSNNKKKNSFNSDFKEILHSFVAKFQYFKSIDLQNYFYNIEYETPKMRDKHEGHRLWR